MDSATAAPRLEVLPLGEVNGRKLALVKRPALDIGAVIVSPQSPKLIAGVTIEPGAIYPDDRGYFTELFRVGLFGLSGSFVWQRGFEIGQFSPAELVIQPCCPFFLKPFHTRLSANFAISCVRKKGAT